MSMIQVNRVGESITGFVNMKPFGVKYTKEKYEQMMELVKEANDAPSVAALQDTIAKFELLTKQDYKSTIETACPDLLINEGRGTFHLKLPNGKASSMHIPQPLVDRILTSVEKGIDVTPIIKFCIRAMRPVKGRPFTQEKFDRIARYVNYTSVDGPFRDQLMQEEGISAAVATERATVFQTPITMEGLLCTYKVSAELLTKFDPKTGEEKPRYADTFDEDTGEKIPGAKPEHVEDRVFFPAVQGLKGGDPFYCEDITSGTKKLGHLIRVGCVHFLEEWKQVNQNDNVSCVKGLHVGNLEYIRGYENSNTETHNVFVDPMHIGAITNDGSGALRVKQYMVHSSRAGNNRGIYHSSRYAAMTDQEWLDMKAEIEAENSEAIAKLKKKAEETNQLGPQGKSED